MEGAKEIRKGWSGWFVPLKAGGPGKGLPGALPQESWGGGISRHNPMGGLSLWVCQRKKGVPKSSFECVGGGPGGVHGPIKTEKG